MHMTTNVHGVVEILARYCAVENSKWTTLELRDEEGRSFDLTVFSDDEALLRAFADKLSELSAAPVASL